MRSKIPVQRERLSAASRRSYDDPEFWEDEEIRCRNCGTLFTFSALLQQDWYERQGKHLQVKPVLCGRCFFEHSQPRRLKSRMDYALRKLREAPGTRTKLEAAETIIDYYRREQRGDIRLALRLAREVLRTHPGDRTALELMGAVKSLPSS